MITFVLAFISIQRGASRAAFNEQVADQTLFYDVWKPVDRHADPLIGETATTALEKMRTLGPDQDCNSLADITDSNLFEGGRVWSYVAMRCRMRWIER